MFKNVLQFDGHFLQADLSKSNLVNYHIFRELYRMRFLIEEALDRCPSVWLMRISLSAKDIVTPSAWEVGHGKKTGQSALFDLEDIQDQRHREQIHSLCDHLGFDAEFRMGGGDEETTGFCLLLRRKTNP